MRNNQPVTEKEYVVKAGQVIVSETDLFGNITYANDAFVEVSGYSRDELMGQPHNILRHPDMPEAAFADMWRSLKLGLPWSGLVKNRRKNGDYYWVQARVSPVFKNGQVERYLSVRYAPPRERVKWAEENYPKLKRGAFKLKGGAVAKFWHKCPLFKATAEQIGALGFVLLMSILLVDAFVTPVPALIEGALFLFIFAVLGWKFYKQSKRMNDYASLLEALSEGQFNNDVSFAHEARFNQLNPMDKMGAAIGIAQANLARYQDEIYDLMCKATRVDKAVQASGVAIMIADEAYRIQYVNQPLQALFKRHQATFQKFLPNFDPHNIIGQCMDVFHKHPEHQRQQLDHLTSDYQARIDLDDMHLVLKVTPIFENGMRHGLVLCWEDQSEEIRYADDLNRVVLGVSQGVINDRMQINYADTHLVKSAQQVNEMLDKVSFMLSSFAEKVGSLAFSNFDVNEEASGQALKGMYYSMHKGIHTAFRNLNQVVGQVKFSGQEVLKSSGELAKSVNGFSDKIQQQAAAIEQTTSAMQQMSASVAENTQNVLDVNETSVDVVKRVTHGADVMKKAIEAMNLIRESGDKINDIISVIDGLAFQTNLLALNAAVEAARAGEHGRGFAVVASEVRSLAQKSAEAASNIQSLIQSSVEQINSGTRLVMQTGEELEAVKGGIEHMSDLVQQVATASKEQQVGIEEVNKAIVSMDDLAQQSASIVEEVAAETSCVASQVEDLESLLEHFQLSSEGKMVTQTGRSPLEAYKQAHLNWMIRMTNVINGFEKIEDVSAVRNHHICGLGKWRDKEGKTMEHLSEMQALDRWHQQFHNRVADLIELVHQGRAHEAYKALPEIGEMSEKVVALLGQLETYMDTDRKMNRSGSKEGSAKVSTQTDPSQPKALKAALSSRLLEARTQGEDEWTEF